MDTAVKKSVEWPQHILEFFWERGLEGQRIRVPRRRLPSLVSHYKSRLLDEDVEAAYEQNGVTFYLEKSSWLRFSDRFNRNRVAVKFNLKPRTAGSVCQAAWKAWRDWFGHKERLTLENLRDLAETAGIEYSSLYLTYLKIRQQLRRGEKVHVQEHTGYHQVQDRIIQQVIELAQASILSCSWRSS